MKTTNESAHSTTDSRQLGDYSLVRRIGAGAYAEVWLARDAVGKWVAAKVIDRERLLLISRKNREEKALELLRTKLPEHPHLIRIHHVGADQSRFYYIMDLADDVTAKDDSQPHHKRPLDADSYRPHTLQDELSGDGAIAPLAALTIVDELLDAIGCLHEHGMLHRDIKPTNVVCVQGEWKLADIGLLAEEHTQVTVIGTPAFMPPSGPYDRTADLYALGKLLYCLVTGNPATEFPSIPAQRIDKHNRLALAEVNAFVATACSTDPKKRFADVATFRQSLHETRGYVRSGAYSRRFFGRYSGAAKSRRTVLAGLSLLVVVGFGWVVWQGVLAPGPTVASADTAAWESLFDGEDLAGWYTDKPHHGHWFVEDGVIRVQRTDEYKTLLTEETFGPGVFRATIIPDHDGARIGIGYHHPGGALFMLMGDKYTWIRGYREDFPPDQPGNWRSFPGPIPRAGEPAELEIEYSPDVVRLKVNGRVLQELEGVTGQGSLALHVWKDDAGGFADVAFRGQR